MVVSIPAGAGRPASSSPSGQVNNNTSSICYSRTAPKRRSFSRPKTVRSRRGTAARFPPCDGGQFGRRCGLARGCMIGTSAKRRDPLYAPVNSRRREDIDVFDGKFATATLAAHFGGSQPASAGYAPFNIWNLGGKLWQMVMPNRNRCQDAADQWRWPGLREHVRLEWKLFEARGFRGTIECALGCRDCACKLGSLRRRTGWSEISVMARLTRSTKPPAMLWERCRMRAGRPFVNSGLWALIFGNGGERWRCQHSLYFAAGIQNETHGLLGGIAPPTQILSAW